MLLNNSYIIFDHNYQESPMGLVIPFSAQLGSINRIDIIVTQDNGQITGNSHMWIYSGDPLLFVGVYGNSNTKFDVSINGIPNRSFKIKNHNQAKLIDLLQKLISSHRLDITI